MHDLIRRISEWVRALFAPRTRGRHRARQAVPAPRTATFAAPPGPALRPRRTPALPARRSRYGLETPLDGEQVALARPYLVACEQERERQQQRRRALLPALDGVDVGPEWIHGVRVGVAR
jgi:hypothetical protein